MKTVKIFLKTALVLSCTLICCKNSTSPTPTPPAGPLQITYPVGGETLHIGDSIQITWTADSSKFGQVDVFVSTDGGATYNFSYPLNSNGSINSGVGTFGWKIGSESPTPVSPSNNCKIRLQDYLFSTSGIKSESGVFKVLPHS
ncbi:MAG: hypothetical protein ABSF80_04130 [Chitinispirillaceae bacterium]|jgi:hypothetical protein